MNTIIDLEEQLNSFDSDIRSKALKELAELLDVIIVEL